MSASLSQHVRCCLSVTESGHCFRSAACASFESPATMRYSLARALRSNVGAGVGATACDAGAFDGRSEATWEQPATREAARKAAKTSGIAFMPRIVAGRRTGGVTLIAHVERALRDLTVAAGKPQIVATGRWTDGGRRHARVPAWAASPSPPTPA